MKEWKIVAACLCLGFVPALIVVLGYTFVFIKTGWELSLIPYLSLPLGMLASIFIYKETKN